MKTELLNTLWLASTRYYIGRMTIGMHAFCDELIRAIDKGEIEQSTLSIIKRDLVEAFEQDDRDRNKGRSLHHLGHDIDHAKWLQVLAAISIPEIC